MRTIEFHLFQAFHCSSVDSSSRPCLCVAHLRSAMALLHLPAGTTPKDVGKCDRDISLGAKAALSILGQFVVNLKVRQDEMLCFQLQEGRGGGEIQQGHTGRVRSCLKEKNKLSFVVQMMSELLASSSLWWRRTDWIFLCTAQEPPATPPVTCFPKPDCALWKKKLNICYLSILNY